MQVAQIIMWILGIMGMLGAFFVTRFFGNLSSSVKSIEMTLSKIDARTQVASTKISALEKRVDVLEKECKERARRCSALSLNN